MQGPGTLTLRILLSAFFLATAATAEVVVKIYAEPVAERSWPAAPTAKESSLPSAFGRLVEAKGEQTGLVLLVPHFKIDSTNPFGETTLLTVRNNSSEPSQASVIVAPAAGTGPAHEEILQLGPRQVAPLNIKALIDPIPDLQGFQRGYVLVLSSDPVSADYFQVNTAQDFAAGNRTFNVGVNDDFCYHVLSRFLVGGGFSGGTELTFFVASPQGDDSSVDPPSVLGDAYDEDGNFLNSFALYSDQGSFQIDAAILVLPGTVGGAFDITFPDGTQNPLGGILVAEYKANNKFSTSLSSECLEKNHPGI